MNRETYTNIYYLHHVLNKQLLYYDANIVYKPQPVRCQEIVWMDAKPWFNLEFVAWGKFHYRSSIIERWEFHVNFSSSEKNNSVVEKLKQPYVIHSGSVTLTKIKILLLLWLGIFPFTGN